jgi:hypothetical protein
MTLVLQMLREVTTRRCEPAVMRPDVRKRSKSIELQFKDPIRMIERFRDLEESQWSELHI